MALGTYSELKDAIQDWMARSDLSGRVADWIKLAEARLNRVLSPVETDQALTGTIGSRRIDVSAYAVVAPVALFLADGSERLLSQKSDGTLAYADESGAPASWAMDGSFKYIDFDVLLDATYTFRFRYRQKFVLSDSAPTNWLLTEYPDIYLAASIVWGGGFTQNVAQAAAYKALLDEAIPEVRSIIAQGKRGTSTVDPVLSSIGSVPYYDGAA